VIDVLLVLSLGIIGYRKHAGKLISFLEKNPECKINYVYHPTKSLDDRFTNDFSNLYDCDAVIIASPNKTHYEYIEKLTKNFKGYIFCEKPPVISLAELEKLEKLPEEWKQKIFFDFMLRFSDLSELIKNKINSDELGMIVHIDIHMTKGLAFKKEYANSWRADGKTNLHNILDANTIHHIDLVNLYLGKIDKLTYFPSLVSKNGTSFDTSYVILRYENGVTLSIFNSYATPLINDISIIGTNGHLTIRNNHLEIQSPRDTFDKNGLFTNPPTFFQSDFSIPNDIENSLKKSLDYFILHARENKNFDLNHFQTSMQTNRLILKLKETEL
jgi:predicted dehydrogenase